MDGEFGDVNLERGFLKNTFVLLFKRYGWFRMRLVR